MNLDKIIENKGKISNPNISSIIGLIVDAILAYPRYELKETDEYFEEIKRLIVSNNVTLKRLENFLTNIDDLNDENQIWILDSLNSLVEAFRMMDFYKIDFEDVQKEIKKISS